MDTVQNILNIKGNAWLTPNKSGFVARPLLVIEDEHEALARIFRMLGDFGDMDAFVAARTTFLSLDEPSAKCAESVGGWLMRQPTLQVITRWSETFADALERTFKAHKQAVPTGRLAQLPDRALSDLILFKDAMRNALRPDGMVLQDIELKPFLSGTSPGWENNADWWRISVDATRHAFNNGFCHLVMSVHRFDLNTLKQLEQLYGISPAQTFAKSESLEHEVPPVVRHYLKTRFPWTLRVNYGGEQIEKWSDVPIGPDDMDMVGKCLALVAWPQHAPLRVSGQRTLNRQEMTFETEPKFNVLLDLLRHHGELLTTDHLKAHAPDGNQTSDNTIHTWIHEIRKSIIDQGKPEVVVTERGKGYRLNASIAVGYVDS